MYLPPAFAEHDADRLSEVMERYSFALLMTGHDGRCAATHLPLLLDRERGVLRGHLALANAQWRHLADGGEALAVFTGPHAYISPTWYAASPAVPTWNYLTVHARGHATLLDDAGTELLLADMVAHYERRQPQPWDGRLPDDLAAALRAEVVGFELVIEQLEGKFKVGQNRSEADQAGVLAALRGSLQPDEEALADAMSYLRARQLGAPKPMIVTYLEQTAPTDLRPKESLDPRLTVVEAAAPQWQFNRFLYCLVGGDWHWRDRLAWNEQQWIDFVESGNLRTLVAYYDGSPAGYCELRLADGEVEVSSFGLAPRFHGLGLGGAFLTECLRAAWAWAPRRVWLHTCNYDSPRALPNYQARGLRVYRVQEEPWEHAV